MSTPELTPTDLQGILKFATTLARKAGDLILQGSEAIQSINEKKNSVDLVTEFDIKVEELVKKELGQKYPDFDFIGEESYSAGKRPSLSDKPIFCVDPIDGTMNFVHGFPYVCISIGLIYKQRPVLGIIYNPFLDHFYTGITGQGSYLTRNSREPLKLPLSAPKPLPTLNTALIAVEWTSNRNLPTMLKQSGSFMRLAGNGLEGVEEGQKVERGAMAHSLRSVGSAALNLAMVAQGGLDIYWEIRCGPWDVCAGIVILQEAGGVVTGSRPHYTKNKDGKPFDVTPDVLAGNKFLAIRAITGEDGEKGVDAQKRIIEDFYGCVDDDGFA